MFGKQKTQLNIAYPQTYGTFARKWSKVALVCAYVITSIIGGFVYQVTPAEAAIPKYINFQGKLTAVSNGNNVANGTYAFEFKIYDDPSAGSLLWTETYDQAPTDPCQLIQVTNGVFNAKLGSCASLAGVDFSGGELYLTVNFAPTGVSYDGEMAPRKQLVSSAYAFVANSVSGDGVVNNAIQSATALSTGRTLANPALQVDTNTASSATGLKVTAAAAAGGIALAAISSGANENLTIDAKGSGTISLGATSTGDVLLGGGYGSTGASITGAGNISTNGTILTDTSVSTPSIITASGALGITPAAGSNLNINLSTTGDLAVNTNDLYVDTSAGKVGIGTTAPARELHVVRTAYGSAGIPSDALISVENDGSAGINIGSNTTGLGDLSFSDNQDSRGIIRYYHGDDSMRLHTATNLQILITSTGSTGIGTSAPGRKLEINDASGNNLRLTYNDSDGSAANYADLLMSSGGDLTIAPSGGDTNITGTLAISSILQAGSATATTYSRLGTGTTGHSLGAADDLLITDDLEVDGDAFFDGNITIAGTCTGCGSGANTALSNLAAVAINTSLISDTDNTDALGSATIGWSDLFLGSGGVINWNNGDAVLTHSAGVLTVSTGDLRVTTAGTNAASVVTVDGTQTLGNKTLTAPKFVNGGFIADANGNEQFIFNTTASAVNELSLTNAATGGVVALATTGGDTDVELSIDSKGADNLSLNGTATGNILFGGGSGSTGCTVTNATGAFACTAGGSFTTMALTGAVTGATGYNGLVITANTGVVTSGTWNGTAVVDTYVADTLTVDSSSSVHWNALNNYPAACAAGQAISQLADTTNICTAFNTDTTITLQDAYDATSGNTITTTTARNIAIVLAEVATPTSLTVENQDTAATSAQRIFNSIASGTATNGLLIEQTGAGTMTNAIQIAETAGTITDGILITGTLGNILNSGSIDITGAGAITGATGISSSGTIAFSGLSTNGAVYTTGGTGTLNSEANLDVTRGGTGVGTFTTNGVLYGNSTSDVLVTAQGAANTVLVANAGAPSFSAAITVGTSVTSPIINGTTALQFNGTDINTAGTLTNVAYENQANAFTAAQGITIQSATALNVARTGSNYAFQVDTNTASSATGVKITAAAAAGGVAIAAISSGTDENITFDAKGAGTISLGASSTGDILFGGGSGSTGCTVTNSNGNFACTGTGTFSNLSGTNTGDVTLAAIGAVPNANGATLTGQVLNLQPASTSFGGVVTTGTQSFTGEKTFSGTGATNVTITNSAATTTSGALAVNATTTTGDFVPGIYSNRIVTGTGSLNAVYGIQSLTSSTAVVTGGSVGQTLYGTYNSVSKTGADTATGTLTSYATYNLASNTGRTNAGTVNTYGGYFSGVGDTAGTSTAYGLHVQASGADNNYAIVTNGGNVGIGDLSPASLFTVGSGDLFQINSSGQIGSQQAPVSDYLFALAGTTGNDNSRIIDITQANNAAEDSIAISIANTANTGSYSDSSIAIKNVSSSITPTSSFFSSAGAASLSLYGDEQNITTSSITMGDTLSNEVSLLVFGQSSSITLSPTINDTVGNSLITANAYGVYSKITSSSPTYTNTNGGANIDTYAGYFDNLGSSTGDANTTYNSYGVYARSGASLSTTGQTTHYGGYLEASTAANTNYGIYITSSGATTNYALYSALGINFMADDVYVGALTETLSNTGFAMNGNDVFIEDKLGVEGSIYSDTSLIVGASTTYANGSISQSSGETLSIGTTSAALTLQTTTSGDINISPAGNVLLAGGSGSTGCTVTGTTGALACTSTIATGVAGGTIGGLLVSGNTSGTVSILPQAAAGTYNFNLPTTAGSSGHVLTSAGGGASAMTWTDPSGLGVRWNALIAPTGNLSLAHGASTTAFTFNSITSGSAFGLSSTSLTSGNLLQATGSGATMTTGGELVDLALGANTVGAGLTVTSTGTYTGVGAADGLINVTANGLTSGYAFQIPHTTSVVSGSLMRLSSTSVDTSTIGSLLSLSSTASTAGTIAMITNNTASFTGTSFSVSNTGITSGAGIRVTGGSGMTTGGELVDLVLGANTVGAGLSVTSTGTYTGVGAADGLVNITANGLTSGYAFQIPHTTSVISTTGSLMRLSSTSVDTGTAGTLLSLASTGSTAGTIAMITNNTASFTGTSFSVSNTGQTTGTGLLVTGGGANLNASGELIDLAMGAATVGSGINVTTTGVYTGAGIVQLTANSATTGVIQAVSTTGLTTGSAIRVTGSGATMQTGGELIDLVLGANTVGAGLTITGTGAYTGTGAADGFLNIVGNSLTTGHGSKMSYTAITSGTGLLITGGSALTTNGELIDLNMSTSAGGQGINITNTGTYTGTGLIVMTANSATTGTILNQSATALTTGRAQSITLGTALTTGGLLSTTGASYLHTGSETGSLVSLAYTDASSNAAGAAVTNGILLSPTINTTASAGSKTINGISIAPTHTACGTTAGTCAYNGITQTTAAVTQTTTNALTITGNNIATAGALVQNTAAGSITWVGQNIQMPNITQTTGTVTSTGLKITGGTVTSGTAYALTTSSTAGNVGIGTTTPGSLLEVNGTAGFGFENLELNGGFESGSFTSAYSDLADGGSGTLTVTSGGGWEGTYFVRNSAQVGGHAFRLRPTFVIPTSTASLSYYGRRNGVANSWGSSPANGVVTPITVYLYDETSATTVCNTGSNSPGTNWTRYNVSCSVTAGHTFSVQVMMDGWSGQYNADIDAVQVEAGLAVMEYGAPLKLSTNGGGYIMGNVGIGTGTVDKKLHIAETVTGIAYSLKLDNYHSSTDDATGILFSVQGDGSHNFLSGRGKGGLVYAMPSGATWNRGDFYFLQDATADNSNPTLADASMVIKNSGDIGIGEVNPTTAKLVINQTDAANLPGIYINSEESTTTQSVFSIESDTATGSGADTVKFKITADGSVYSDANVYGTPADVAEMYNISGPVTAGDVVEIVAMTGRLDGEKFGVKRHEPTSNAPVLGVISTAPGTTLGYEWKRPDILAQQKPVALVGRVPIKVTNENGAIMPGDFLVASATQAGYAMKATKAGPVIGQALDKLTGTTGSITAFIKPTNYNGVNIEDKIAGGLDFDYGDEDQTAQTSEQMLEHLIAQLDELDYDNLSQINTDLVIAGAEVVSPNVTTQTLRTDFLSSATADGSLTVASATIMNGGLIVDEIGSVGGLLSMMSDVEFFGTPYFTVDTAGFAVIKAGVQSVDVTFSREYLAQPIVNASVSFEQDVDQSVLDEEAREVLKADAIAAAQTFLAEGVSYVITNKSKFGFTIVLSKPAPTDVKMSWTALAVRNASTFMSLDTPEGFVAGAGDPGDGVGDTPPGDGSGDGSGDGGTPPPGDGSGGETPPPSDPPPSDPPSGDGSGDGGIGG